MADFSSLSKEELELLLMSMKKELDNTRSELSNAKNELDAAKDEISTKAKELSEAKDEIANKTIVERFAPSSEKLARDLIINEVEKIDSEPKRRNSPYKQIVSDLKKLQNIEEIIIDYDFDKHGVDKSRVKPFGEDESYKLEIEPVKIKAVKVTRLKYKDKDNIYEELINDIFPHSLVRL